MAVLEEPAFLALNALYLKKTASAGELPDIARLPADQVQALVRDFVERGWVMEMDGQLLIQPEGMTQVEDYYREAYADISQREEMGRWYERFEPLNERFIALVTEWQQTQGDARVQQRVIATVERLCKLISEMTGVIPRYAGYIERFERSISMVDQGKDDFVCTPTVDSLHNIWFEFHEDFLTVLGRPRDT